MNLLLVFLGSVAVGFLARLGYETWRLRQYKRELARRAGPLYVFVDAGRGLEYLGEVADAREGCAWAQRRMVARCFKTGEMVLGRWVVRAEVDFDREERSAFERGLVP